MNLPKSYKEYYNKKLRMMSDDIMTNFDHSIDEKVAKHIKDKPLFSRYAGWEFNGKVWWLRGKWHCDVWRYHSCMETVSAKTLKEIMEIVCDKYGKG